MSLIFCWHGDGLSEELHLSSQIILFRQAEKILDRLVLLLTMCHGSQPRHQGQYPARYPSAIMGAYISIRCLEIIS